MKQMILERCREASSWRGLIMVITAFGVSLSPETMDYIIAAGTGVSGLIGMFVQDGVR